jgi:hypothetical protein
MNIVKYVKDQFGIDIERLPFRGKIIGKMSVLELALSRILSVNEEVIKIYANYNEDL